MSTFKQSIEMRCKENCRVVLILTNGIRIEVNGSYIEFCDDFLQFDRIAAEVNIPDVMNFGNTPRMVKIPYAAIAIFTEESS